MTIASEENRALRREKQFHKRLAVIENIGRPGGITNKMLCDEYGFTRISIRKQAKFLSLDVKCLRDADGRERYFPARPLPVSVVHRYPSGNELHIHGLTEAEAVELNSLESERV
jgi:hypothetical protein